MRITLATMRRNRVVLGGVVLVAIAALGFALALGLLSAPHPAFPDPQASAALDHLGNAQKGRLIFEAADCASCHASPGQSDRLRLGGGLALASPFGTLRAPNISPDPHDGIGRWHTSDLANALLSGVSPKRTHYYPVLPYTSYGHMRVSDICDLMAYLRTLPRVSGRPPPHDLPFPFNIRRLIGLWKLLFFHPTPISADPARTAAWNRGRYLVEAVAHCADCHSSRNLFGAVRPSTRYAGGEDPSGVGFVPDITPLGLHDWTERQWLDFLETGTTPDLRIVGSSMAEVLTNVAALPESDRQAITTYLLTLPSRPSSLP
jgi:mono/diheme cytochrome c family protein